ncbi:LacI family DNA-binding transcriptional regulator [Cohnella sp. GCM10012308]|uniref:LacI family DNA-binding transcriptional regulator n=1 Tax=Cohnella sp. GCM10012308 TaxID=3317329 RepID=UPI0036122D30
MTTIEEIATQVGVSAAAAARVLSYDPSLSVGDELRRRIFEAAAAPPRRMGATASESGRGARARRIGLLGIGSAPGAAADWHREVRSGVERACARRGIECVPLSDPVSALAISPWSPDRLDGLISIGSLKPDELARLPALGKPTVFVGSSPDDTRYDSVVVDYSEAMERLIDHWTGLGFRRFVYIGSCGPENETGRADRLAALRTGLDRRGLGPLQARCASASEPEAEGRRLMAQALRESRAPTAFVLESGRLAAGAADAAREAGRQVSGDAALVVLDGGGLEASLSEPPFATVRTPAALLGESAVTQLADRLRTQRLFAQKTVLNAALFA